MTARITKILIVDYSYFARKYLSDIIKRDPDFELLAAVGDAREAQIKIAELRPDMLLLDIDVPHMNSMDFLKQVLVTTAIPVLALCSAENLATEAMQAGAKGFISKGNFLEDAKREAFLNELPAKIKHFIAAKVALKKGEACQPAPALQEQKKPILPKGPLRQEDLIIAIGASTGGTEATSTILKNLRGDLPGIVMVQHMPPVFTTMYADRLRNQTPIAVKEAKDGDEVLPGQGLLAPGGYQMQVVKQGGAYRVKVFEAEKVSGHCPSVDVLFSSVAKAAGASALGVLLTGMGADGARGLLEMHHTGATTFGQNKETCVVYGMPMVAKDLGAVTAELPLDQMAQRIMNWHLGMKGK